MSDLSTRIRDHVDSAAPPIDVESLVAELIEGTIPRIPVRPAKGSKPQWPLRRAWISALVLILVLGVGAITWLLRPGEPVQQPATLGPPLVVEPENEIGSTGAIRISLENLVGMEGYRLLAGVWANQSEAGPDQEQHPIAGGAFWVIVDDDPFSAEDLVHPPADPLENTRELGPDEWGAGDYQWEQRAWLDPGQYRITLWANPDVLHPYGSHIPAEPIERTCWVDVEVTAGEVTQVGISGIPLGSGTCPTAEGSLATHTVTVNVTRFQGHDGWEMAGVLYRRTGGWEDPSWIDALGGFSARVNGYDFSTTQVVRQGVDFDKENIGDRPFPYVSEETLMVEPGSYTLVVWANRRLLPYSRWVPGYTPGGGDGLRSCIVDFEVRQGIREARISVDGGSLLREGTTAEPPICRSS